MLYIQFKVIKNTTNVVCTPTIYLSNLGCSRYHLYGNTLRLFYSSLLCNIILKTIFRHEAEITEPP